VVDCSQSKEQKFCKSEGVTETPTVKYYPPSGFLPPVTMTPELFNDAAKFKKKLIKQIPNQVTTLTAANVADFMAKDPTKPKIVLFSKQDKPAWIFKAISSAPVLERTLDFGFTSDPEVAAKYKKTIGKKLPALAMFQDHGKKSEKYTKEMIFRDMKEWANTFSESGMGDKVQGSSNQVVDDTPLEERKPWLAQDIPELHQASHRDICFKDQGLCVMYLIDGKLSGKDETMLKKLKSSHESQLEGRGAQFKWMYMDMSVESGFEKMFNPPQLPSVAVFNPHKRLRWVMPLDDGEPLDGPVGESDINNLIEKILAGDARFKMVKGQKLPAWTKREAPVKQEL